MVNMNSNTKVLHAAKFVGGSLLLIGLIILSYSIYVSDSNILAGVGVGTIVGAVFIFLMGIFFVATEEMLEKSFKGVAVIVKKERLYRRSFR
jgi:hypothetical protein